MKVLVIGGSYFLGRIFTMTSCKDFELTLVNRGNYSMQSMNVEEYHFDRHDENAWRSLPIKNYDAVVDFCAYQKGDIKTVIENFKGQIQHYILISTVDVYQRQTGLCQNENHPLEERHFEGEVGEYIYQKVLLEKELREMYKLYHIPYTSIRPGNIYGPFNYAPRESEFIRCIALHQPLLRLTDAQTTFQLVYVKDVADAIILAIKKKAYCRTYNVVSSEKVTYDAIYACLQECSEIPISIIDSTIQEAIQSSYPLPYPLLKEEKEIYNGQLICQELGLKYTSLKSGMKKTYQAFLPVYIRK